MIAFTQLWVKGGARHSSCRLKFIYRGIGMSSISKDGLCKQFLRNRGRSLLLLAGTAIVAIPPPSAYAQGVSFGQPTQIVGTTGEDAEPPLITKAGKNVYIVWHEFPDLVNDVPDIYLSRSTNGGRTFGLRKNLSNSATIDSRQEQIAASKGNVFVVWIETDPVAGPQVFFTRSTNSGASFTSPKKLSDVGNPTNPRITASEDNVFVAWQANSPPDIFLTQSADAGANFSNAINVSNNNGDSEFAPVDVALHQIEASGKTVTLTWRDNTPGDFEIFFANGE
jgi:hypothetical protein